MTDITMWGVGDQAASRAFDTTRVGNSIVELIHGEHPHSRRDNTTYARNPASGVVHGFDGHRRLIDITITSSNYLKSSYLSGEEIRKAVTGAIVCDGTQVYEFTHRHPDEALLTAHRLLRVLQEHESDWLSADARMRMVGRKIYYHDVPATIAALVEDQGCVMIATAPGVELPSRGDDEQWDDWREGNRYVVKDDVLSPHIWWWRDDIPAVGHG